jgi:hypothetical protein
MIMNIYSGDKQTKDSEADTMGRQEVKTKEK